MILLIFLVVLALIPLGIGTFFLLYDKPYGEKKYGRGRHTDFWGGGWALVGVGIIITIITFVTLFATYTSNQGSLARLEAFYQANSINYEVTVDSMASYLSLEEFTSTIFIEGSVEKLRHADNVALAVQEWRDSVNTYNEDLATMKRMDKTAFLGIYYPTPYEDLKLLKILE